jgi:hypothetical protein
MASPLIPRGPAQPDQRETSMVDEGWPELAHNPFTELPHLTSGRGIAQRGRGRNTDATTMV